MNPELRAKYGSPLFPSVNLIPKEIAEKKALRRVQSLAVLAIVAAIAVVVLGYLAALATVSVAQGDLDDALQVQTDTVAERDAKIGVYVDYVRIETEEFGLTQVGFGEVDYAQFVTSFVGTANAETSFDSLHIQGPSGLGFGGAVTDPVFGVGGVGTIDFAARATSYAEATALIARIEALPGVAKVVAVTEVYANEGDNDYLLVTGRARLTTTALTSRLVPTDGIAGIDVEETIRLQDPNAEPLPEPVASPSPAAEPSAEPSATDEGN